MRKKLSEIFSFFSDIFSCLVFNFLITCDFCHVLCLLSTVSSCGLNVLPAFSSFFLSVVRRRASLNITAVAVPSV